MICPLCICSQTNGEIAMTKATNVMHELSTTELDAVAGGSSIGSVLAGNLSGMMRNANADLMAAAAAQRALQDRWAQMRSLQSTIFAIDPSPTVR
jgi:hypothetical protein